MKPLAAMTTMVLALGLAVAGAGVASADDVHTPVDPGTTGTQLSPDIESHATVGDPPAVQSVPPTLSPMAARGPSAPPGRAPDVTETYTWLTARNAGVTKPVKDLGAADVTWPQDLVGIGDLVPSCGLLYQVDVYTGTRSAIDAVIADKTLTNVGQPEDHKLVTSWKYVEGAACPTPPADVCPSDFKSDSMWEVTWGYGFADRNGGTPKFTMQSNGGLIGINGTGTVPSYMGTAATSTWHWLYINKPATDKVTSYQFKDGTQRSATVTADTNGCPTIVWAEIPPVTPTVCTGPASPANRSTNLLPNGWSGDGEWVKDGYKLTTAGNWADTSITRAVNLPLKDVLTGLAIDATPSQYVGLHFHTSMGDLVYELGTSYNGRLWSTSDFGVQDETWYKTFGTPAELVALHPDLMVTSVSLVYTNDVAASSTITSVGFGCSTFTFDHAIPAGQVCTATGAAYTEDGFPAFTAGGQQYLGGSGHALNWLVPTSGNLQGITSVSYTISAATGYQAAYRFVLYANGTTGYTSVTAEPYMNGWVAGETGTFTIDQSTLVWNSHISSGPGSQSQPVTVAAMAALIPNNQFISQGIHLGSTAVAGQNTTVSAIDGCASFVAPIKPRATTRQVVKTKTPVCTVDESGAFPGGGTVKIVTINYKTPFVWSQESHSYIPGTEVQVDKKIVTYEDATLVECPPVAAVSIDTDPLASSCDFSVDDTGLTSWISVRLDEGVVYKIDGTAVTAKYTAVTAGVSHHVTAEAATGFTLVGTHAHEWDLTAYDSSQCELINHPVVTPQVSQTLATCTADGSYTFGLAEVGEDGAVTWTVNGKPAIAGTYTAPAGTTLNIVATATEGSGISGSEQNFQEFTITIAASSAPCAQLTTLAFTGTSGDTSVFLIAALLLLLTGVGALTAGRLRSRES